MLTTLANRLRLLSARLSIQGTAYFHRRPDMFQRGQKSLHTPSRHVSHLSILQQESLRELAIWNEKIVVTHGRVPWGLHGRHSDILYTPYLYAPPTL